MPNITNTAAIAILGTFNVDYTWCTKELPRPGTTLLADTVHRSFGGKGANQAVAAARAGADVTMIGMLGTDADGEDYLNHMKAEGIDISCVSRSPDKPTGTAFICVDRKGENLIMVNPGANAALDIRETTAKLKKVLPLSKLLLLQLETPLPVVIEALHIAASLNIPSVLNASPSSDAFPWGKVPVHAVIINEHECMDIFSVTPDQFAELTSPERHQLLEQKKVTHLIITQGAKPTIHISISEAQFIPTHSVTPVDTVGAGDTFTGVLAATLAAGADWESAIQRANIAAALSTLSLGAQSAMPKSSQIDSIPSLLVNQR